MPRPSRPWFRFYVEALHDPKIRRLAPSYRWLWIAVLGAARMSCLPGWLMLSDAEPMEVADLADLAGLTPAETKKGLAAFERSGLIVMDESLTAWKVARWADRQFESDEVNLRSVKHRRSGSGKPNVATLQPPPNPVASNVATPTESPPLQQDSVPPESESESESESLSVISKGSTGDPPQPVDNDDDDQDLNDFADAWVNLRCQDKNPAYKAKARSNAINENGEQALDLRRQKPDLTWTEIATTLAGNDNLDDESDYAAMAEATARANTAAEATRARAAALDARAEPYDPAAVAQARAAAARPRKP